MDSTINDLYTKTIETIPVLHSIEDFDTALIFDEKTNSSLNKLLCKFKKSDIKHIKNFPITFVVKGINQFYKNHKRSDENEKLQFNIKTKVLIFKEFESNADKKKLKKYQEKAEEFCLAEIYSYILYTALEYEIVTFKELKEREFEQAIVIIVDVCYFKIKELMPYFHPRMLLILKSKSSNKNRKKSKHKKSSEDEESEEEIDTKKKKSKGKKNKRNTSESDNESDSESSDEAEKKKKSKRKSRDSDNDESGKKTKEKKNGSDRKNSEEEEKKSEEEESEEEDSEEKDKNRDAKKKRNDSETD